ncbi:MAG: glycosyltransferase family 4 protein [Kiritimatiellae bacterium]|nr:glycosyltransferase family 4 protein [Kiritimatiellia bacterium]MDD5521315.1 glycosyltransferase family 4 protein [Kiritimatiellia bacterium]
MKEKTVFIISHCFAPNIGGVETHLIDLTNHLQVKEIPTFVLTYQPLVTKARGQTIEHRGSVTICRLPWVGFGLFNKFESFPAIQFAYLFPVLFTAALFVGLINKNNISVIHCHGMICAVIGRLLKACLNKRVIVSIHAVYGWLYNLKGNRLLPRFLKWVLVGIDKVLALSEASRRELIEMGLGNAQTGTFTYWVDQTTFCPMDKTDCRHRVGLLNRFTVLFVGRMIPVKGVETLLKVATVISDVQFVFAGDGPLASIVQTASKAHENIIFAGRVDNRNLPVYYNAADILCVPSQYEEGFGRIILESLSCGCPVIASRRGGIPEALDESVGMLIEPDTIGIRSAIQNLMTHPEIFTLLQNNCRPYAEKHFGPNNADRIIDAYQIKNENS